RLNIAAALMHQPLLLYLDEPTVGIDTQSRALILERLSRLRSQGTAMVYTTHYMEEVEELCDRVMILDQGTVIADGAPADLVRTHECGNLQELYLSLTGRHLRD
ncbi:MAG: ABC transporter ATP-binding protein, partial [Desulfobulbaceae bacterium]|nr:ABC transporter ATP-binding protein [Desulfobulbaceae bacterium]